MIKNKVIEMFLLDILGENTLIDIKKMLHVNYHSTHCYFTSTSFTSNSDKSKVRQSEG